jgi:hypothetical protein
MKLLELNFSQFKNSKLSTPDRGQMTSRVEGGNFSRINSVFLRNRNSGARFNWQTELLKLEELL